MKSPQSQALMPLNAEKAATLGTFGNGNDFLDDSIPDDDIGPGINILLDKAKGGCISSCLAITELARSGYLPSSQVPGVLETFVTHLSNTRSPEKASLQKFQLADVSLYGMCFVMVMRQLDEEGLRPILQGWPSILDWAEFKFMTSIGRNTKSIVSIDAQARSAMLIDCINKLGSTSDDIQAAALDKRLLSLAMRIWSSNGGPPWHKYTCITYFDRYIETNIMRGDTLASSLKLALDDLYAAAQDDPARYLDPVHAIISVRDTSNRPNLSILHLCVQFLGRFAGLRSHPISIALKDNGLPTMCKALSRTTEPKWPEEDILLVAGPFCVTLSIFSVFSKPDDGPLWLLQALKYPIFRLLPILSNTPANRLTAVELLLSHNLPAYLANPAVIFATVEALSELSAEQHQRILAGTLSSSWKTFVSRLFEQYVFYCYFEVAGTRRGCHKCGEPAGGDATSNLKRCGACKLVEYCSSSCQTTDWTDHKKKCKLLRNKKRGPLSPWAFAPFRRRLAAYDARRHLPGIRALTQQKYPGLPVQCMSLLLNYGRFPPQLYVQFASEAPLSHELLIKQASDPIVRELCFDDVRLHDGSTGLLAAFEFEDKKTITPTFEDFHWSPPFFCSDAGTQCRDPRLRRSFVTPYLSEDEREIETGWSVVDEIVYRSGLSPKSIFDGKLSEVRRTVIEVVAHEKTRMQMAD